MRLLISAIIISTMALGVNLYPASASIKPGSACTKEGQVKLSSGKKYTCIKKNKKLSWDKGVNSSSTEKGISVDKNLLSVDVTIPASFYGDEKPTQESLNADAKKNGYGKATLNSDGSVTFRMSKAEHRKALAEMKKSVDEYIQETVNDSPKIFRKVTYNKNMTEFEVLVDKAAFEEDFTAGMIGFGIGVLSAFFQMFNGGVETPMTTIKLLDKDTGKVFDTLNWPEKG